MLQEPIYKPRRKPGADQNPYLPPEHEVKADTPLKRRQLLLRRLRANPTLPPISYRVLETHLDRIPCTDPNLVTFDSVETLATRAGLSQRSSIFAQTDLINRGMILRFSSPQFRTWLVACGLALGFRWPEKAKTQPRRLTVMLVHLTPEDAERVRSIAHDILFEAVPARKKCSLELSSERAKSVDTTDTICAQNPPDLARSLPIVESEPSESEPGNPLNVANGNGSADALGEATLGPTVEAIATTTIPEATPPDKDREYAAWRLSGWLMGRDAEFRFRDLRPQVRDDGSIEWKVPLGAGPAPSPAELAEIERLKPEFLKALENRGVRVPRPAPAAGSGPSTIPGAQSPSKAAPAVPRPVQAEVRHLILELPGHPDTNFPATVARAIAEALCDRKPESLATFAGLAADVRNRVRPVGCLLDGFEAGCSNTAKNRGASFVNSVKKSLAAERKDRPSGARGKMPDGRL